MEKIIPNKLKIGDTIGVMAPSEPIVGKNIEEIEQAKKMVEKAGFKVKYSKNLFSNTNGYSATAEEKAQDLNGMFTDKEVKMIWCAKGGLNSNSMFDYIDYESIKKNPKIITGYSDITSITNMITQKTGLVTFCSTNFKTIATDETDFSYNEVIKRFVEGKTEFALKELDKYITLKEGSAEGELVGGTVSLIKELVCGKYSINLENKILFIEELGLETEPGLLNNYFYYMKQNDVFKKIKGIWLGSYEHESGITIEKILLDVIKDEYKIPIIKSNNFGHIETKTVIPIGTKARIDTSKEIKIELIENCVI